MSAAQKPDTAIAQAFAEAGYKDPWDELFAIAIFAWLEHPGEKDGGERRSLVIRFLRQDSTWALLTRFLPGARAQLIGQLLNMAADDIKRRSREAVQAAGGGHIDADTHLYRAPATPSTNAGQPAGDRQNAIDTQGSHAVASPHAGQPAAHGHPTLDIQKADAGGSFSPDQAKSKAEPGSAPARSIATPITGTPAAPPKPSLTELAKKHAAATQATVALTVRMSALDQKFDGQTIGDLTPDQALTLARKNAVALRFIVLLSAGVPKDQPIRKFITPDEADAVYARATRDVTTAPWPAFNDQTGIGIVGQRVTVHVE
jgi:hypothetical protein